MDVMWEMRSMEWRISNKDGGAKMEDMFVLLVSADGS